MTEEEKKGKRQQYNRKYYLAHKEQMIAASRKYQAENKERRNEYSRKYYAAHKDEHAALMRRWRENNPEKVAAYAKEYYLTKTKPKRHAKKKDRVFVEAKILDKLEDIRGIMDSYTDEDYTLALYVTRDFLGAYSHSGIRAVIDCQLTTKGGTDGGETEVPAD